MRTDYFFDRRNFRSLVEDTTYVAALTAACFNSKFRRYGLLTIVALDALSRRGVPGSRDRLFNVVVALPTALAALAFSRAIRAWPKRDLLSLGQKVCIFGTPTLLTLGYLALRLTRPNPRPGHRRRVL